MKQHRKKMIAPILISVLMVLYYIAFFSLIFTFLNGIWKFILGIVPLVLSAVMIAICVERIKEIRKGEEDDLSKY